MDRLEPLFIPPNSSPWREWQDLFLVPMYATGISFGMRINKVTVASRWHRGARLHREHSTTKKKKKISPQVGAGTRDAQTCLPSSLNSEGYILSIFTIRPIVTFLSALDNTQHSCRSTSYKASQNTKIPFHFPPKSYLTVWGSTFKNMRINSDLTQARTTQTIRRFAITTNVLIRPT